MEISKIIPDPDQPRKQIVDQNVNSLAESLKTEGLINPIEIDETGKIITGELRYQAAKKLGWDKVKVNIYSKKLNPYERLRRQMAENLHQSGSKGEGQSMNPIDTARGWRRLYELKAKKKYSAAERSNIPGPLVEVAREVGVSTVTVWGYLELLKQPQYVVEDLLKGRPKSQYVEVHKNLGKEVAEKLRQKIAGGDFSSRSQVRRTVNLIRSNPSLAVLELNRKQSKENANVGRILTNAVNLAISLKDMPLSKAGAEKSIIINQLQFVLNSIEEYLKR